MKTRDNKSFKYGCDAKLYNEEEVRCITGCVNRYLKKNKIKLDDASEEDNKIYLEWLRTSSIVYCIHSC